MRDDDLFCTASSYMLDVIGALPSAVGGPASPVEVLYDYVQYEVDQGEGPREGCALMATRHVREHWNVPEGWPINPNKF